MYLEAHLRATHSYDMYGGAVARGAWCTGFNVTFERHEIEFLHRVYAKLDAEPDGLMGVSALRSRHNGAPGTGFRMGRTTSTSCTWAEQGSETRDDSVALANSGHPSMLEQIQELEHAARWGDALACYEQAIERVHASYEGKGQAEAAALWEREVRLHEGQLKCLRRAGNLQMLVSLAEGK